MAHLGVDCPEPRHHCNWVFRSPQKLSSCCLRVVKNMMQPVNSRDSLLHFFHCGVSSWMFLEAWPLCKLVSNQILESVLYEVEKDILIVWHHWLNGHAFEQTLGDGEGEGSLVCCSWRGCKESDTTEWLNNKIALLGKGRHSGVLPWKN